MLFGKLFNFFSSAQCLLFLHESLILLILQDAALRKDKFTGYRLMTSVSIPVFDKKNHTVRIFEKNHFKMSN